MFIIFFSRGNAETYKEYRTDDFSYKAGGGIDYSRKQRINDTPQYTWINNKELYIYNQSYVYSRFFSQKGGVKQESARKYSNRSTFDSEFGFVYRKSSYQFSNFISPKFYYQEADNLSKSIHKDSDIEWIVNNRIEEKISFSLEFGRGFQRLDKYGLFFAGMANYIELEAWLFQKNVKLNLIGLLYDYNYSKPLSVKSIQNGNRLYGASLFLRIFPLLKDLNVFFYRMHEPLRISQKKTFFQDEVAFNPHGDFFYLGFETQTKEFRKNFFLEFGFIQVYGFRDMAEYFYQHYNSRDTTRSFLGYFVGNYLRNNSRYRFGFLKTSKDESSRIDKFSNGYAGLLAEPRIFGGRSSFLLMQSINLKDYKVFGDLYENYKNQYENKGTEFFHIGYNFQSTKFINYFIALNYSLFEKGRGYELIFMPILEPKWLSEFADGYFLFSICVARVKPFVDEYGETQLFPYGMERQTREREYLRFYLSTVIRF